MTLTLRSLHVWALLMAVVACGLPAAPNIVLVVSDDQGYWDLHSTGNPYIDTPNLDRLAGEGVRFERFYVQPVCAPTRAGLMTGRYYLRTGLYNTRFGGDTMSQREITVADLLKKAGYRTGILGKWHLGRYHGYQPNQRGFDEFLGFYEGHLERSDYADQLTQNGRPVETRGYVTDLFTDAALQFMDGAGQKAGAPFFCYLAFSAPHIPHVVEGSSNLQKEGDALLEKYLKRGVPLTESRIYAQVERIDRNVGRVLKYLEDRKLADNTVVFFMSDNGGVSKFWKGDLRGNKGSTYQGGVRAPLFARWPGHFAGGKAVPALTSHVDLLPTLCELAGVRPPSDRVIDGRSLVPLLTTGEGERHHRYIYQTWNRFKPESDRGWGIRDERHALVGMFGNEEKPSEAGWQLFDLKADPGETKNLAKENPEKTRALRAEFLRWYGEVTQGVTYEPVPIPVGHDGENPCEIQASWASGAKGATRYQFDGYDWDTIEGWSKPGARVEWRLEVAASGRYEVQVAYGCAAADAGGLMKLSIGNAALTFRPQATATADVFVRVSVGELIVPAGSTTLRAEVVECPGKEALRLNRIWLRKLP